MRLTAIRREDQAGHVRLIGHAEWDSPRERREVFFDYPARFGATVAESADPFVPALLVPCLARGERLSIDAPVSARLLHATEEVQACLARAYPRFRPIQVEARSATTCPGGTHTASLFSLGVDSFWTLMQNLRAPRPHLPRLDHVVYMRGIEARLEVDQEIHLARRRVEDAAARLGVTLIPGETNLRSVFPLPWRDLHMGAGLASIGLSLGLGMRAILLPSSEGTVFQPAIDALWSTEATEVVHDGHHLTVFEKLEDLARRFPEALPYLRVCMWNHGGLANCGRCGKCIRTTVALETLGALPAATGFRPTLDSDWQGQLMRSMTTPDRVALADDLLRFVAARAADSRFVRRVEQAVQAGRRRFRLLPLLRRLEHTPGAQVLHSIRRARMRWIGHRGFEESPRVQ